MFVIILVFFCQAEDGIRGAQESRGLGDVYKRQPKHSAARQASFVGVCALAAANGRRGERLLTVLMLSLIHI